MKVVHINISDQDGGAAIAASRHCEAMKRLAIDSIMVTLFKSSHKPYIKKLHLGVRQVLAQVYSILNERKVRLLQSVGTFSLMCYGHPFHKNIDIKEADVIVLHWVNKNCLSLKGVEKILKLGKPTFWYMHDMFPITGGCHHSLGCEGYKYDCDNCPLISSSSYKDIAAKQLKRKIHLWKRFSNLEFITPSMWLGECVKESNIANGHKVHIIPNVINTDIYTPVKANLKSLLALNPKKKTIIFSAATYKSVYKGAGYMYDFLRSLNPDKYEAIAIGMVEKDILSNIEINVVSTGYLYDDLSLVVAYNCADVLVISSVAENYPNVVLEAMACGLPCVGFPVGGIAELIKHKDTGYLTENLSSNELKEGIEYVLEDEERYKCLSENARKSAVQYNSFQNLKEIYKSIIRF